MYMLCLVVCLTLLSFFFLPSHLSLKHVYVYTCIYNTCMYIYMHCVFYYYTWEIMCIADYSRLYSV